MANRKSKRRKARPPIALQRAAIEAVQQNWQVTVAILERHS